ncbi:glucosyl-dolichyl phosphate glucuronosyltransferase [Halopiger xanaduensis]|uniref:Glycosyl transferase family 2 n=1 Tax=Halopiger xanaduensis (strain DSM 18323 / JCM 14033 / SH-6) TaxID=797210 RepID=F8DA51_HALXS|nr:glucosyl-dolichyl phosphate glucuronosyltransferase [Halopiger xanaduensis]AEH36977.1 glycosyl transferase family 2 [Halopiger xanaduensis SH-6]
MKVSVVICIYSMDRFEAFSEAVESVLDQTYEPVETILIVDGNQTVYERVEEEWGGHERITVYCNDENVGLSMSRNRGAELANGDVIAFLDDDAVADEQWVKELVSVYEEHDVEAVGGKMVPQWVAGKPTFLPEEFYWLVGVTYRGFPNEGAVRNTFGSNISFRADVLSELGGFDPNLGRKSGKHVQGEETELAARLRTELNGTLYYTPDAKVKHKIFDYRTRFPWLAKRAFWQGYSKHVMKRLVPASGADETAFLKRLVLKFVAERVANLFRTPDKSKVLQLWAIFVFTVAVGLGYIYGMVRNHSLDSKE